MRIRVLRFIVIPSVAHAVHGGVGERLLEPVAARAERARHRGDLAAIRRVLRAAQAHGAEHLLDLAGREGVARAELLAERLGAVAGAGQNSLLGWDGSLPGKGAGAKSMGRELARSDAFASCQVQKVFKNVCFRSPSDAQDRARVQSMTASFKANGYQLKRVFAEAARYCMGD